MPLGRATLHAVLLSLAVSTPTAAARSVIVVTSSAADARIDASQDAIRFWNGVFEELGVDTRFGPPEIIHGSPVTRVLENYARVIAQRAFRLPAGDAEPDAPIELTNLDADVVILLSRQNIMSFAWPVPRHEPPRYLVVIRLPRSPDRGDPMVSRHVVAHELGHTMGLAHNEAPDTLMCGPCQPLVAVSDASGFLPLTASEQAQLRAEHPPQN